MPLITGLLEQCYLPKEKADFWIEDSCLEVFWTLIFLYFESLARNKELEVNPYYQTYIEKIAYYFEHIDETVSDVETLKTYMYDTNISRSILSIKLD